VPLLGPAAAPLAGAAPPLAASADASWSWAPGPILLCLVLLVVYVTRWRHVRRGAAIRGGEGAHGAPVERLLAFVAGVVCVAAALISPLDHLAEQVFAMHMVQHVLLLDIAPILLILGLTRVILRPVARQVLDIERALGPLAHPITAVVLYVAGMYFWHIPAMYDAALEHSGIHVLEHIVFLSIGLLYWWHLLSPVRSRTMTGLVPVVYMASTKVFVGMLGILLTFAPEALYDFYKSGPRVWGLDPLNDQAAAGAIMAIEQSIVMGIALFWLFVRALEESERDEQRAERYADQAESYGTPGAVRDRA
jgi:cytochrome c oxidase assembly factor CtaG